MHRSDLHRRWAPTSRTSATGSPARPLEAALRRTAAARACAPCGSRPGIARRRSRPPTSPGSLTRWPRWPRALAADALLAELHAVEAALRPRAHRAQCRRAPIDLDLLDFHGEIAAGGPGGRSCRIRGWTGGPSCCCRWPISRRIGGIRSTGRADRRTDGRCCRADQVAEPIGIIRVSSTSPAPSLRPLSFALSRDVITRTLPELRGPPWRASPSKTVS